MVVLVHRIIAETGGLSRHASPVALGMADPGIYNAAAGGIAWPYSG